MTITDDQVSASNANPDAPTRIFDPKTAREYVLLPVDVYERLRARSVTKDAYPAIDRAFADGWNAPGMDDYDQYEARKR